MSHFGTRRRQAFCDWVEADMPPRAAVQVYYETESWPAEQLLGQMSHCKGTMADGMCDDLHMGHGTSFAVAATQLLAARTALPA